MQQSCGQQALCEKQTSARRLVIICHIISAGLQIAEQGSARRDAIEVVDGKRDAHLVCDGEKMQNSIG